MEHAIRGGDFCLQALHHSNDRIGHECHRTPPGARNDEVIAKIERPVRQTETLAKIEDWRESAYA